MCSVLKLKGQFDNLYTLQPSTSSLDFFLPNYMALTFSLLIFQLYELDGDPKRKEFLDDLFNFMQKRGKLGKLHIIFTFNEWRSYGNVNCEINEWNYD